MKKAVFSPFILALLVLLLVVAIPNTWIESMIPKTRIHEAATELNPVMFQGKYIQGKMLADQRYLPIYGSSELARLDKFHPSNYFQVNYEGFTPFLIGRGGSISLIHFLALAEHPDLLKDKKLVFILSPQWFQPQGADEIHFAPNYSTLQGYDLAFNRKINPRLKRMVMKRLLKFNSVKNDIMLSTLYKAEISNDPWGKRKAAFIAPFAYAYKTILEKKDLYFALAGGSKNYRSISPTVKNKSWAELKKQAHQYGARYSQTNQFRIINSQYAKIRKKLPALKNYKAGASYGKSVEYHDFQLVLDLLKEAGAKPLFISVPVNGWWYDYTGFPKAGRTAYYKRIKQQVEKQGFPIVDFSDHEYDPYFMKDTIHIGWKGWVYTDKAIQDFYNAPYQKLVKAKN